MPLPYQHDLVLTTLRPSSDTTYQVSTYDPAAAPLRESPPGTLWFAAPANWREEGADGFAMVTDGATCWFHDPGRRRAVRANPANCDPAAFLGPADLRGLVAVDRPGIAVALGPDGEIAGRRAYSVVLTFDPLPIPARDVPPALAYPPTATGTIVRTLWIDRDTYLLLGLEDRDAGGTVLVGWAFTALDLDPAPDPARFAYTPPADYAIIDQRGAVPAP